MSAQSGSHMRKNWDVEQVMKQWEWLACEDLSPTADSIDKEGACGVAFLSRGAPK